MKTQILTRKATGATLLALIVSGNAIAQTQNSMAATNDETSNTMTLVWCVLLFIVGFAVLYVLKRRDDKKHENDVAHTPHHPHILHRNHYGHRHQYHH